MTTTTWLHLTARALPKQRPLASAPHAFWLWRTLRRSFGPVAAACVMPDHVHLLLAAVADPTRLVHELGHVMSGFTRHVGDRRVWSEIAPPTVIADERHLLRTARYVHLNPCRDGLVGDPLAWPWSTHRGAIGAEVDPWVSADTLASYLHREGEPNFAAWFHGYVSRDPACAVNGSALPKPATARVIPAAPLASVISAVIAATPWVRRRSARRRLIVQLADHQGWRDAALIGRAVGLSADHVRQLQRDSRREGLAAAALCLGDARLRFRRSEEQALLALGWRPRMRPTAPQ